MLWKMILLNKEYSLFFIIAMNGISYFLYYLDKQKARQSKRRISERTLLIFSFLFGGVGAWLAMKKHHHKTKKVKFKLLIPIAAIITIISLIFILNQFV